MSWLLQRDIRCGAEPGARTWCGGCAARPGILGLRRVPIGEPPRGEALLRLQEGHGIAGRTAPVAQPARRMVPVMAETVAVPAGGAARTSAPVATMAPVAAVAPVAMTASAATTAPAPVATTAPAPVARSARPVLWCALAVAPAATLSGDRSGPAANTAHADLVLTTAVRDVSTGVPVCPFLGFKNDPSTRCDYADPGTSAMRRRREDRPWLLPSGAFPARQAPRRPRDSAPRSRRRCVCHLRTTSASATRQPKPSQPNGPLRPPRPDRHPDPRGWSRRQEAS